MWNSQWMRHIINIINYSKETLHWGSVFHKSPQTNGWGECLLSTAQAQCGSGVLSAGSQGALSLQEFWSLGNSSQHSGSPSSTVLRQDPPAVCRKPTSRRRLRQKDGSTSEVPLGGPGMNGEDEIYTSRWQWWSRKLGVLNVASMLIESTGWWSLRTFRVK